MGGTAASMLEKRRTAVSMFEKSVVRGDVAGGNVAARNAEYNSPSEVVLAPKRWS